MEQLMKNQTLHRESRLPARLALSQAGTDAGWSLMLVTECLVLF